MPPAHRIGLLCIAVLAAAPTTADDREADFDTAFGDYRSALAEKRYSAAADAAAAAMRTGSELFAADARRLATLAYNLGHALSEAGRDAEAYATLRTAGRDLREAFGEDAIEVAHAELAMAKSAPKRRKSLRHFENALGIALLHHGEDSPFVANVRLMAGMRLAGREGLAHLREAARNYERSGDAARHAVARFWMGKGLMARDRPDQAAEHFEASVALVDQSDAAAPRHRRLKLMAHANLIELYEEAGQRQLATRHCLAIGRATPWGGKADYQPLYKAQPMYPRSEWERKDEGDVLVAFTVDENGFTRNPTVVESDGGELFERSALAAVAKFRYAPRFVDGKPVAVPDVLNRILFRIR